MVTLNPNNFVQLVGVFHMSRCLQTPEKTCFPHKPSAKLCHLWWPYKTRLTWTDNFNRFLYQHEQVGSISAVCSTWVAFCKQLKKLVSYELGATLRHLWQPYKIGYQINSWNIVYLNDKTSSGYEGLLIEMTKKIMTAWASTRKENITWLRRKPLRILCVCSFTATWSHRRKMRL